jgi:uncharacterized membrane protein
MNITGRNMKVKFGNEQFVSPIYHRAWNKQQSRMTISGGKGRNAVNATLDKTNACTDGITQIRYPFAVNAKVGGNKWMRGCCRAVQIHPK